MGIVQQPGLTWRHLGSGPGLAFDGPAAVGSCPGHHLRQPERHSPFEVQPGACIIAASHLAQHHDMHAVHVF